MATLAELLRAMPHGLLPVGTVEPRHGAQFVSGVHVSELLDPTPYLDGGELLLTTGLSLSTNASRNIAYAKRLQRHGISALAIGLGPVHDTIPPSLVDACASVDLPLFVVPGPVPFQEVTRAYWRLLTSAGQAALHATLGAHRDLARAAMTNDPLTAVLRVLAGSAHGWAARLDARGDVRQAWPRSRVRAARGLHGDVDRLRRSGPYAAATFPLGDDDVIVHPLVRSSRVVGYVAIGAPRTSGHPDRGLVLAACSLLTTLLDQEWLADVAARERRSVITHLLLSGLVDAAREVARSGGIDLPARAHWVAVDAPSDGRGQRSSVDLLDLVAQSLDAMLCCAHEGAALLAVAPDALPSLRTGLAEVRDRDVPTLRAVASPVAPWASLASRVDPTLEALRATTPGQICEPSAAGDARDQVAALQAYDRAPLVPAVAAHLRHRGNWERSAADLAVHRNTMRQRIDRAERVLDVSLDDPDVASRLWLALRDAGLA